MKNREEGAVLGIVLGWDADGPPNSPPFDQVMAGGGTWCPY